MLAGYFNDFRCSAESSSKISYSDSVKTKTFSDNISKNDLMDLGCSGPMLTWNNGRQGLANTKRRLDRALANPEWRMIFPEATVSNLPRTYSDHSPILINMAGNTSQPKE